MQAADFISAFNRQHRRSAMNVAEMYTRVANGQPLKLYESKVPAGFPSPAEAFVKQELSADDYLVRNPRSTVYVRVEGDSMIGAKIFNDDVIVVDKSLNASKGDIVVAWIENEGYTVKYLGDNRLIPANSKFPIIYFLEGMNVRLFGVVVGAMRRFD